MANLKNDSEDNRLENSNRFHKGLIQIKLIYVDIVSI